jgi:hypothetical protein
MKPRYWLDWSRGRTLSEGENQWFLQINVVQRQCTRSSLNLIVRSRNERIARITGGNMYVLSILAYRLATACVVFGVALLFRRRDVIDPTGTRIYETSASYFARIREAAVALLLVCLLLIVFFWAIVHFGPLRPVHEWLRWRTGDFWQSVRPRSLMGRLRWFEEEVHVRDKPASFLGYAIARRSSSSLRAQLVNQPVPVLSKLRARCPVCAGDSIVKTDATAFVPNKFTCTNCESLLKITFTSRSLLAAPVMLAMIALMFSVAHLARSGFLSGGLLVAIQGGLAGFGFAVTMQTLIRGAIYRVVKS